MPYSKTLTFNSLNDISFEPSADDIKIKVSGTLLGAINKSFPVTIFVTESGGTKSITLKQIDTSVYTAGNTDDLTKDTISFNYTDLRCNLFIDVCTGSTNRYKTIGWTEDMIGQTCIGSGGATSYFEITSDLELKVKIEQVNFPNSIQKWRMVARYATNVMVKETSANALCYSGPYCYACN